jgi:(1->4)-alpha-D-glucan 1-alpha-D-glucosylmutase
MTAPPRATYRLQLHQGFTFADATALIDYLAALGVSHVYASPFLKARPGSLHGYDITDHDRLNPEIGSDAEFAALSDRIAAQGMGLILDFVPNHMGIGKDNAWWMDVLEWGETSPYAEYFDIDWQTRRADTRGKVLLPVLGDQYGLALERGEIELRFDAAEGSFSARYYEHRFPISPWSYAALVRRARGADDALALLARSYAALGHGRSRRTRHALHDEGTRLKAELAALAARRPQVATILAEAAVSLMGRPGEAESWRRLHALLQRQFYRLAYWRAAADEINYRRFFNIDTLAGIRIESPELFARAHRRVLALVAEGRLDGLRIDHIDGLFDPRGYCERLQREASRAAPTPNGPFYITIEKILAPHEALRDWPIAGTTGYDFIGQAGGLLIDQAGEQPLTEIYERFTGRRAAFEQVLYESKKRITAVNLASETNVLARAFHQLAVGHWRTRDFTLNAMRAALDEIIAAFPVYRTYVAADGASAEDRRYIEWAVGQARRRWPGIDTSIFDFIEGVLTGDLAGKSTGYNRAAVLRLAMRFQQLTGPVMAKGAEDTAFYRYARLIALNEVGGDPRRFGLSVAAFHHVCDLRAKRWPHSMLAGSTHDTKRGEDARARLMLLSEMPEAWAERLGRWDQINALRRGEIDGEPAPDRNDEYIFYQTVLGAWPPDLAPDDVEGIAAFANRVKDTMIKIAREAKERSSWSNPNAEYEAVLGRFVLGALDASRPNPFIADMYGFVEALARPGAVSSLALALLRLAAPGVPDTYQGAELWDFSMVDPDNRRPVDWPRRRAVLDELRRRAGGDGEMDRQGFAELAAHWRDGREKLFLIWRALALRKAHPELFAGASYQPLETSGRFADRLCAFARIADGGAIVACVPRLVARLPQDGSGYDWGDTAVALPPAPSWRDALSGRTLGARPNAVPAAELLADFPVALWATP